MNLSGSRWFVANFVSEVPVLAKSIGQLPAVGVAPVLNAVVLVCCWMTMLLFVEWMCMGAVIAFVKVFRRTPEKRFKWEPFRDDDVELRNASFPMVLVQIPMYNEKEVYKQSIGAVCELSWPCERFIVQVLDDSTDPSIKEMVEMECERWARRGMDIKYEIRDNRNGYKAGALSEGMRHSYVKECEYVVIFDADFQPDPDFLRRAIPYLVHNPDLALVQARWKFVNADECFMTRTQEISLNFHFSVEQEVGSSTYAFFSFNGTAGVWRIASIEDAGGWNHRTTVEDMDLAVRASLKGWKFLYLSSLKVNSELPSSFKALRNQQHRWSCGPANLFRKMFMEVVRNKNVNSWKKIYIIYSFFFVRKVIAHVGTFVFYCLVLPTTCLVAEVDVPKWGTTYVPFVITIINILATPRSLHLVVFWILFENVMAVHRAKATIMGLFGVGRVNEWVVTEKLGDAPKLKSAIEGSRKPYFKILERWEKSSEPSAFEIYWLEEGFDRGLNFHIVYGLRIRSIKFDLLHCNYS
ncbi:unnamed protein product [Cuscuta europaea]|uniref:glucomannan 4-beta-mannosyltransferase n=1 Tax=Cuscuta europaea TaxID=41803 RepID=A0A9P0ZTZ0_CUSEU|nr:unnamed protein product [Cuscuta europaea]